MTLQLVGSILVILGVVGASIGYYYYQDGILYRDKCDNILGQTAQLLSQEIYSNCVQKASETSISTAVLVGGIAFFIIGFLFIGLDKKRTGREIEEY